MNEAVLFRRVLSRFGSGIVVVSGLDDGTPTGLTCQSFASLSLDPPLVVLAVGSSSMTWPVIAAHGRFAVNILSEHQESASRSFAVSGARDKFAEHPWRLGSTGLPLLSEALAHIECSIDAVREAGDHRLVIGRVLALHDTDSQAGPLLYYRSSYRTLS